MSDRFPDQFQNICLVHTGHEGDAGAFERAVRFGERTRATLNIVSVIEEPAEGLARLLASWGVSTEALSGDAEEAAEVERLATLARDRGVNATSEVLRGSAFMELTRKVLRDRSDLLIKSVRPPGAIHRVLFGHVDRQLLRKCPCPVWIEKPSAAVSHNRILAAVDPAPFRDDPHTDPVREELNSAILRYARLLAEIEEAEFHVVHAWPFDLQAPIWSRAGLADDAIARVGEHFRQRHDQALAELVRPYMRDITRVHLVQGDAGEQIAHLAARASMDVIVMGTMHRRGVSGLFIGKTAETVLDLVDCSIVAIKPPGFVSPVQA